MRLLVLNGPNLNLLGVREKDIYGNKTYDDLVSLIESYCTKNDIDVCIKQSNHEGVLVDIIQSAINMIDAIIINPAAYTHTSIAMLDALKAVNIPSVEVHISDVDSREDFRKISFVRQACIKTIKGLGFEGYIEAIKFLQDYLSV